MDRISIIGAGMMGPGIAQVFATYGYPVNIYNRSLQKLDHVHERVAANLEQMAQYGLIEKPQILGIIERITICRDLETACRSSAVVIETVTESLPLKQELFAELDRLCPPSTVLCSNTSVLSITEIGRDTRHSERVLGMHFYQPPHLVPLVEVIRTEHTLPVHMDNIVSLLRAVGKEPIRVQKDVPGFIANRMQHALWREAFALVDEGICDAATIDTAVRNSFGMRLPVLGPVANADLVGLDLTLAIHDYVLPHLSASVRPSSTLKAHVQANELGFKTKSGFLNWTEASMDAMRNKLTTHLLETLSRQKAHAADATTD